jgi:hypothetical protein
LSTSLAYTETHCEEAAANSFNSVIASVKLVAHEREAGRTLDHEREAGRTLAGK